MQVPGLLKALPMPAARFAAVVLLALATLFGNVASAVETCLSPLPDSSSQSVLQAIDVSPDEGAEKECCGALCHCCMHLFYISRHISSVDLGDRHLPVTDTVPFYHFQLRKPPTEPPRG